MYSESNSYSNSQLTQVVVYMNFTRALKFDKKKFLQWLKKISAHFDHYDLINEEDLMVQFWYVSSILSKL